MIRPGFFLDTIPSWFPPLLLILSILPVFLWPWTRAYSEADPNDMPDNVPVFSKGLSVAILLVITVIILILYGISQGILAVLGVYLGRWIEGLASARFWVKIQYVLTRKELPPGKIKQKLKVTAIVIFLSTIAFYLAGAVLLLQKGDSTLHVAWTLIIFLMTAVSMWWKSQPLFQGLPYAYVWCLIMLVCAGELFNYGTLMMNAVVSVTGIIPWSLGYVVGSKSVLT
jgi:hypothetical protein